MMSLDRRSPTIDDLKTKMCWICREEEISGNEPENPSKAWVHPCSCTLIAHQACLLAWIKEAQAQPARRENALKCPQCGTKYVIDSRNPIVLRCMEYIDGLASRAGKFVTMGLISGICISFAGSIYGLCTLYGAHAARVYVGDRLYDIIIGDDPKFWDWKVYLNLPLVPFYLILSHTRAFDDTVFSSTTFSLFLSLCFPTPATLSSAHRPILLPRFFAAYPPTPWLCVILYPILRTRYLDLRERIMRRVLDLPATQGQTARPTAWVLEDHAPEGGRIVGDIRFDLDINHGDPPQQAAEANPQNVNANAQDPPRPRRVRLTFSSLGRFMCAALATPWIAKYMGTLLELLARRSVSLRRVLALDEGKGSQYGWMESVARESSALTRLQVGILPQWQRWDHLEPVWWRNSLGLGLWIVAKDAVTLLYLFLRQRELKSRRIMSRSFTGIDVGTLDLISPAAF